MTIADSNPVGQAPRSEGSRQIRVMEPRRGWRPNLRIGEIWDYRDLAYFHTRRAITVRYKQTVFGPAWAIIRPTMTMIVFTILFGRIAQISTDDIPAPVFYYSALIPWTLFSGAITGATGSLTDTTIRKVYFPRPVLPLTNVLVHVVDMAISLLMLAALMAFFRITPTLGTLILPALVVLALATALGVGFWLAPLNAMYRDVGKGAALMTSLWMYASPVIYPASEIQKELGDVGLTLYFLNPTTGIVEGFRWALTGQGTFSFSLMAPSIAVTFLILFTGLWFFRRQEAKVIDVL
jgi:lipopolysaccharide transport system permease protein